MNRRDLERHIVSLARQPVKWRDGRGMTGATYDRLHAMLAVRAARRAARQRRADAARDRGGG